MRAIVGCAEYQKNRNNECILYIIDQHGADERIKYYKYIKNLYCNIQIVKMNLEIPTSIFHPSYIQTFRDLLIENDKSQKRWAINMIITSTTIYIYTIPSIYGILLTLENIFEYLICIQKYTNCIPPAIHRILQSCACHSAIRFNTLVSYRRQLYILRNLSSTDHPFICAHGRPIVVPLCILPTKPSIDTDWKNWLWSHRSTSSTFTVDQ